MEKLDYKDLAMHVTSAVAEMPPIDISKERPVYMELVPKADVLRIIRECLRDIKSHNDSLPKTYTKVMYVEDGSVDTDELAETLIDTKLIIYRQGSNPPTLKDVSSNPIIGY